MCYAYFHEYYLYFWLMNMPVAIAVMAVELKTEESALTGESLPAEKDAQAHCPQNAPLGERKNMVFASTGVASGAGVGVTVATGMDTAMGKIARMLQNEKAPQTPLQQKLKQTGKVLGVGVVLICGVIFLLGLFQRMEPLEMFMIAISLGVAAIPEGLTAVFYLPALVGMYMILLHTVVNGWRKRHKYRDIIATSMMKFQGRQTVRNMLVMTLLIAGAISPPFTPPC